MKYLYLYPLAKCVVQYIVKMEQIIGDLFILHGELKVFSSL